MARRVRRTVEAKSKSCSKATTGVLTYGTWPRRYQKSIVKTHPNYINRILILFAHPALQKSRVNRVLAGEVRDLDGVAFNDLYERYPEFDIDVTYEQGLLLSHDVIVFHHPFFWYSTPSLLKEWQDLVLAHGWAYGREGTALRDQRRRQNRRRWSNIGSDSIMNRE